MSLVELIAFLAVIGLSYWTGFRDGETFQARPNTVGDTEEQEG